MFLGTRVQPRKVSRADLARQGPRIVMHRTAGPEAKRRNIVTVPLHGIVMAMYM
jgi:hypothetical protein